MKPTFQYRKHIVRDLSTKESFECETSVAACKLYDERLTENPTHKLLYEVIYPDYKLSEVCRIEMRKQ